MKARRRFPARRPAERVGGDAGIAKARRSIPAVFSPARTSKLPSSCGRRISPRRGFLLTGHRVKEGRQLGRPEGEPDIPRGLLPSPPFGADIISPTCARFADGYVSGGLPGFLTDDDLGVRRICVLLFS